MRNTAVLIAVTLLTFGCNGSRSSSPNDQSTPRSGAGTPATGPAQQPGPDPTTANHGGGAAGTSAERSSQLVTLVGCLQGPSTGATGTAGSRNDIDRRAAGTRTDNGTGTLGVYRLTNATAASSDSAGTGANGAGASGGPLVNAPSTFVLDGVPANAEANVNKQVRVTGRIDVASGMVGKASTGSRGTVGSGSAANTGTNATTSTTARTEGTMERRLTVESVQAIGQNCAAASRP